MLSDMDVWFDEWEVQAGDYVDCFEHEFDAILNLVSKKY